MRQDFKVTVPVGEVDGLKVERFTVGNGFENLRLAFSGRSCTPGTYTRLQDEYGIWMTDTDAEVRDHLPAIFRIRKPDVQRVLINGLGLGLVVRAHVGFPFVNAAAFYGKLADMKRRGLINGGMANGHRCYWSAAAVFGEE